MSADLFAVFGAPDEAIPEEQLNGAQKTSRGGPSFGDVPQPRPSILSGGDVLFDAEQAEFEDDFGDFEDVAEVDAQNTVRPSLQQVPAEPNMASLAQQVNLLDLESDIAPEPVQEQFQLPVIDRQVNTKTTNEVDKWGDFEDFAPEAHPGPKPAIRDTASQASSSLSFDTAVNTSTIRDDDDWDDFEPWDADQSLAAQSATGIDGPTSNARQHLEIPDEPRPAHIPPPTVLLQLLPQVFHFIQEQAKASHEPADIDETAASIITVFAVSARIIAGRSLRWKRDTYLGQSTRIGPSTSGARSGGMKLTAVNKSEAIREEREAADVCDAWSRNTHIFAGVVTRSEHRRPWMNLNIKMTPRPSPGFGTLEAREPCALCGIKRDERIAGVDFDADDVFSEYWTEYWGHTDCKVFWYTYRDMLDHR